MPSLCTGLFLALLGGTAGFALCWAGDSSGAGSLEGPLQHSWWLLAMIVTPVFVCLLCLPHLHGQSPEGKLTVDHKPPIIDQKSAQLWPWPGLLSCSSSRPVWELFW